MTIRVQYYEPREYGASMDKSSTGKWVHRDDFERLLKTCENLKNELTALTPASTNFNDFEMQAGTASINMNKGNKSVVHYTEWDGNFEELKRGEGWSFYFEKVSPTHYVVVAESVHEKIYGPAEEMPVIAARKFREWRDKSIEESYNPLKEVSDIVLVEGRIGITVSDPKREEKTIKGVTINFPHYTIENPVIYMASAVRDQEGLSTSVEALVRAKMLSPELQVQIGKEVGEGK